MSYDMNTWGNAGMSATQDNECRCQLRGSDKKKNEGHSREIGAQGKNLKMILLHLWSEFVWPVLWQISSLFQHCLTHSCGPRRSCQLVNLEAVQRLRIRASLNSTPPLLASMDTGQTTGSVFTSSPFCCRSGRWVVLLVPQFKTLIGLNRVRSCWNQLRWERRSCTRGGGGGESPRGEKWQMYMETYHDWNNSSVKVISMK